MQANLLCYLVEDVFCDLEKRPSFSSLIPPNFYHTASPPPALSIRDHGWLPHEIGCAIHDPDPFRCTELVAGLSLARSLLMGYRSCSREVWATRGSCVTRYAVAREQDLTTLLPSLRAFTRTYLPPRG